MGIRLIYFSNGHSINYLLSRSKMTYFQNSNANCALYPFVVVEIYFGFWFEILLDHMLLIA
jgi:hypothetical protein